MLLILLLVTVCVCDEATNNSPVQYVWSPYTGYALLPQHLAQANTGNVQHFGNTAGQEYRFDSGYHSVNNINLQNLQAPLHEADRESKTLHLDETVEGMCENEGKKILAVWRVVTELLGLNQEHKIGNLEEVKRLSLIIKSFLALSKKQDFNQMSIRQILGAIQEHLNDDNLSREILEIIQKPEVEVFVKDLKNTEGHDNVHFSKNFDIHKSEINFIKNIGIEEDAALIEHFEKLKNQNDDVINGPPDLVEILNIPSHVVLDKETNSRLIGTNAQMERMIADDSNSNIVKLDKDERIPYIVASESGTNVLTGELSFNEVSKISSLLASTEPNIKAVLIDVSPNTPPIHSSDLTSETIAGSLIKEEGETLFSPSKSNFKALLIELSSNTPYTFDSEHVTESHVESLFDDVPKIPSSIVPESSHATVVYESPFIVDRTKIPVVIPVEHIADEMKSLAINENPEISSIIGAGHTSEPHIKAVLIGESSNSLTPGQTSESNGFLINESTKHLINTPIVSVIDSKSIDDISETKFKPLLIEFPTHVPNLAYDHISESHTGLLSYNEAVNIASGNSETNDVLITGFHNEPPFRSQSEALVDETIQTSIHTPFESHINANIIEVPVNKPILSSEHNSDLESLLIKENDELSSMYGPVHFPESNIKTIIIQSTNGHDTDISKVHAESSLIKQINIPAGSHSENSLTVNIRDDSHSVPILPHANNHYSGKIVQSYDALQQIDSLSLWQEIVSRYGSCTSSRSRALLIEVKALLDALEMEDCVFVQSHKTINI